MREGEAGRYALERIPEPPCTRCDFTMFCGRDRLACAVFACYVERGIFDPNAPRRPTRSQFRAIFRTDEEQSNADANRNAA
jgi:hypothetical protein